MSSQFIQNQALASLSQSNPLFISSLPISQSQHIRDKPSISQKGLLSDPSRHKKLNGSLHLNQSDENYSIIEEQCIENIQSKRKKKDSIRLAMLVNDSSLPQIQILKENVKRRSLERSLDPKAFGAQFRLDITALGSKAKPDVKTALLSETASQRSNQESKNLIVVNYNSVEERDKLQAQLVVHSNLKPQQFEQFSNLKLIGARRNQSLEGALQIKSRGVPVQGNDYLPNHDLMENLRAPFHNPVRNPMHEGELSQRSSDMNEPHYSMFSRDSILKRKISTKL